MTFRASLALGLLFFTASPAPAQAPDGAAVDAALRSITEITGFPAKKPVPLTVVSRAEWKKWVDEQITENVKPEEIRVEELVLKKFGLVPQDFDLRKATVDLLGEQAAAVYDHRKKRMLFVEGADDLPGMGANIVLVHELSHALADQQFDLRKMLGKSAKNDEAQMASMAAVEGQAMWVMMEAMLKPMGQSLAKNSALLQMAAPNLAQVGTMFPEFANAPLYMRETLMFPYTAGLMFQQKTVEKLGKDAFAAVLRKPPQTTQQVLHVEKYFDGTLPKMPEVPDFPSRGDYKRLTAGTLGELDLRILIEQHVSPEEARAVSPHWNGAVYELLENRKDKRTVLRWAIAFDTPEAAQQFLSQYRRVLLSKWKAPELEATPDGLRGKGGDGAFVISRDGLVVTGLEGLAAL